MYTPSELAQNYEFIRIIGEGANGKTWLAQKLDTKELVAIKSLKLSKIDNIKSYELFLREAQVLQNLDIAGVPKFYENRFTGEGEQTCYLIQEYIEAPSLLSQIEVNGQFDEQTTLEVMLKTAQILHALHSDYSPPIIHRDIKPSNILCQICDSEVRKLTLIDFGAVANPQKKSGGSTVAGTFGYMAPEQMMGDVTPQADYYGLGATALHMVTGLAPYEIPTSIFTLQFDDILQKFAPELSEHFIELLHILLNPDVQKRPKNARILLTYIRNVKKHKSPIEEKKYSICDEYLKRIREEEKAEAHRVISDSDIQNWFITLGLVRAIFIHNNEPCAEYTFESGEQCFAGLCPISQEVYDKYKDVKLPIHCTVRFDPADAHFNMISKIQNDPRK